MPLPTLTELRAAVALAPENGPSDFTALPGYPTINYNKSPTFQGDRPAYVVFLFPRDPITGEFGTGAICTVDDLSFFESDTTHDVEVSADHGTDEYYSQSAGADTLYGPSTIPIPLGIEIDDIELDDFGPLNFTVGDDEWHVLGLTTVPTGYALDESPIFNGVRPRRGPWVTPADVPVATTLPIEDTVFTRQTGKSTVSFADACETPPALTHDGLFSAGGLAAFSEPWFAGQVILAVQLDALIAYMSDAAPSLPAGAVGIDYDSADPASDSWVATPVDYGLPLTRVQTFSVIDTTDVPIHLRLVDPATLTPLTPWPPGPGSEPPGVTLPHPPAQVEQFYPGVTLSGMPTRSSTVHLPTTYSPSTGAGPFTAPFTLDPADYAATSGAKWAVVVAHYDCQISHVEPGPPNAWIVNVHVDNTASPTVIEEYEGVPLDVAFSYQPRRYRFIYPADLIPPPQRQFPRDDGLGISTRRSWPPVTSKQLGLRRGATATYE